MACNDPKMKRLRAGHDQVSPGVALTELRCFQDSRKNLDPSPFCYRYRLEDQDLEKSIRHCGILTPLVARREKGTARMIAGHKRFHAACRLGMKRIPVIFIEKKISDSDAFQMSLISNWKQEISDMDRVVAIRKAIRDFRFKPEWVRDTLLPLLGLPAEESFLEYYRTADSLEDEIKNLLDQRQIPFKACALLLRFLPADQKAFACFLDRGVHLTSSQCLQSLEWLGDIAKRDETTLLDLLRLKSFRAIPETKLLDPRKRGDLFLAEVRQRRFPGSTAFLKDFSTRSRKITSRAKNLRIEPVASFEEPGIELHARLRSAADVDGILKLLSGSVQELNALFDFKL
jgi:hypothetical protein